VDALLITTKAAGLQAALERVETSPPLVLPLLNGLDHIAVLRRRFGEEAVVAGTIRVEADRPEPGVVVHTSRFLRVDMASEYEAARAPMQALASTLSDAGIPARVGDSEPEVMWSKLVRLNALACTTSAFDKLLGEIRSTPELRAELVGAIEEGCAVAQAEGASITSGDPLGELTAAHDTLGSSMQRDIAAGRPPELDAIPGSVLRAATRHGISCPTIERLVGMIAARAGVSSPVIGSPVGD
jgi:2-dehydropantoate 2-reductase